MEQKGNSDIIIYQSQDGLIKIDVHFENESVWLSQAQMCTLFGRDRSVITKHIRHAFEEGELEEEGNVHFLHIANSDKPVKYYSLDVIISVGYRVKSLQGTQFRIWATQRLREYLVKGFALNDERFKSGSSYNYFKELLDRIREIRLSEKVFYQQIKDIYATSIDYNRDAPTTRRFFATVQNKLHYAVHGQTAAELIRSRADADQPHMGLTTWASSPDGKILPSDVIIGKNYLTRAELEDLGRLVNAFLDLAESRARRHIPMTMQDWADRLDAFLDLDDRQILEGTGRISKSQADDHALSEFQKYRITQDRLYTSDFDRLEGEAGVVE